MPREAPTEKVDRVFYDGTCGLCHGTVRFLSKRRGRARFRFAPMQGETFTERVPEGRRRELPDSVVVETAEGDLLVRSEATLHLLRRLGRPWSLLASGLSLVPRSLRDAGYDLVARSRRRFFRRPRGLCPVVEGEDRRLFEP